MADKYKVLIGFNVKQKDGSEVRVEPGGKQFTVTNTEKDGVTYQESKPAKEIAIEELLTPKQIKDLTAMQAIEITASEKGAK
jgi:hypothetical protein